MTPCFAVWVGAMLLVAVAATVAAVRSARRAQGRWGDRLRIHEPESDGPYREGSTTQRIPRGTPLSVWCTALVAPTWGSVTLLLLAPMCALLAIIGYCGKGFDPESPPCDLPGAFHVGFAIGGVVLLLSGIVLGSLLIRSAITLPTAGAAELRAGRLAAIFGGVHHAAALAWWATASVAHDDLDWLPVIAVPCAFGVLVALVQWRASAHVARALAETAGG